MVKSYLKKRFKKLPEIIIVEGFWNLGKTKLINYLSKEYNYIIIPEPNHLAKNIKKDISRWYRQKHWKRYKEAIKQLKQNKKIIMERSIISSLAFDYAKTCRLPSDFGKSLREIRKLRDFLIIFLYGGKNFVNKEVLRLGDFSVKNAFQKNPDFYQNYLNFYQNILPPLIDNKMITIKINNRTKFNIHLSQKY